MLSTRLANNVTWMNTIYPGINTMFGNGSIVKKTSSLQSQEHLSNYVQVASSSHP